VQSARRPPVLLVVGMVRFCSASITASALSSNIPPSGWRRAAAERAQHRDTGSPAAAETASVIESRATGDSLSPKKSGLCATCRSTSE